MVMFRKDIMTKNLKWFTAFGLIWSAIFYTSLNWAITETADFTPILLAIVYGFGFYIAGNLLGEREKKSKNKNLSSLYAISALFTSFLGAVAWVIWWQPEQTSFIGYLAVAYMIAIVIMLILRSSKK